MSIKLNPRQRQIATLKQRGASNKEIAIVLRCSVDAIKSEVKRINIECKTHGVDLYALPVDRTERMALFHGLVREQIVKERFGESHVAA